MAKVYLICGKLCSGKSTYAAELRRRNKAVLLSCDEIMLSLFDPYLGDQHDTIAGKTKKYLYEKSVEILDTGINVILDWGFWRKKERDYAKEFYQSQNIAYEFHYLDINDETWKARLNKRNQDILNGNAQAYFVDDNLAQKFERLFEMPDKDEMDVWVREST